MLTNLPPSSVGAFNQIVKSSRIFVCSFRRCTRPILNIMAWSILGWAVVCVWDPLPARLYNVQIKVHRFMGFYKCKSKWQIFIGVPSHCWRRLWLYWHWTLIIVPRISAPKPQDWQRARSLGFFYVISAFVRIRTILYKNFKTWFPTNPWNEYGFQQSSKHSNSKALRC